MKKTLIILTVFATIVATGWKPARSDHHATAAADESKIIVAEYQWSGKTHPISLADLKAAIKELPIYRQENYASKEGKAEYLQELIDEKLQILAAKDKGFDKDPEFLKKAEDYKHQLMVERITEIEVDEKVAYTDADLKAYYEEHKAEDYREDAKSRATSITLTDEELAQATLDRIKAGEDIIAVAKELAEAGKLTGPGSNQDDPGNTGFFAQDVSKTWQEFVNTVFDMEIGEITEDVFEVDISDTETYYLIFRKEEYQPEHIRDFEEVKDRVESAVERQKKRERIGAWITDVSAKGKLKTYAERIPEPPKAPEETEPEDEQ